MWEMRIRRICECQRRDFVRGIQMRIRRVIFGEPARDLCIHFINYTVSSWARRYSIYCSRLSTALVTLSADKRNDCSCQFLSDSVQQINPLWAGQAVPSWLPAETRQLNSTSNERISHAANVVDDMLIRNHILAPKLFLLFQCVIGHVVFINRESPLRSDTKTKSPERLRRPNVLLISDWKRPGTGTETVLQCKWPTRRFVSIIASSNNTSIHAIPAHIETSCGNSIVAARKTTGRKIYVQVVVVRLKVITVFPLANEQRMSAGEKRASDPFPIENHNCYRYHSSQLASFDRFNEECTN